MDQNTATVELGGRTVVLHRPEDVFERMEIWELGLQNLARARGVALGRCWWDLHRPEITLKACSYNLAEYGAAVVTELLQRGYPKLQVLRAGNTAYKLCVEGLITADDVRAAEGNSDGEEGSPG